MANSLYNPERDDGDVFDGNRRLLDIVEVRYRDEHTRRRANARQLQAAPGDRVVVDAKFGPTIAEVLTDVERQFVDGEALPEVLRRATEADLEQLDEIDEREQEAYKFALERIRDRQLEMKLIRTQYIHDGSRLVFYFSADGRIDFRALVRDLAARFKTRIEMRQIGVRDGAQMLGGIGPCGRELCCSTFLDNFEPISIRMAKEQGLTLSPDKISGMCGRLMCCLVYEQKVYRRLKSRLPETGQVVSTENGMCEVHDVDVISRTVTVVTDDGTRRQLSLDDIAAVENRDVDAATGDDEKLWDDGPPRK